MVLLVLLKSILAALFSGMNRVSTFSPLFMKIGESLVLATKASVSASFPAAVTSAARASALDV